MGSVTYIEIDRRVTCMEVGGEGHKHGGWWEGSQAWRLVGRVTSMKFDGEGYKHGG